MAKPKQLLRHQRKTLLAVGEGKSDVAFLKYLRSLYCSGMKGVSLTVRNAFGKGPENVVETAISQAAIASYDNHICLMDTDIAWSPKILNKAKRKNIDLIGSTPCLEGLLLTILSKQVPYGSTPCKQQLKAITTKDMFEPEDYAAFFSQAVLENSRIRIPELDRLLCKLEGK